MSEMKDSFAADVIRQSREQVRKWRIAFTVMLAVLIVSNAVWAYAYFVR